MKRGAIEECQSPNPAKQSQEVLSAPTTSSAVFLNSDISGQFVLEMSKAADQNWYWWIPSAVPHFQHVIGPSTPTPESITAALRNVDVLEEIFLNLPPHVVVRCRLVCHQWKEVADLNSLWRERCRREGYRWTEAYKFPEDWRLFYFLSKKRINFIKNPTGEEGMKDWDILKNGGDGWRVTGVPQPHPNEKVQTTFANSFFIGEKSQTIDLRKEGYNSFFMDQFQPDIRISDWIISRWDCGSQYHVRVELLNWKMELLHVFAPRIVYLKATASKHWNQMTHTFQNYGPGVRYIRFIHGGKDIRFWKGFFGVHITQTCVEICPAMCESGTSLGRSDQDEKRKAKSRVCSIS